MPLPYLARRAAGAGEIPNFAVAEGTEARSVDPGSRQGRAKTLRRLGKWLERQLEGSPVNSHGLACMKVAKDLYRLFRGAM